MENDKKKLQQLQEEAEELAVIQRDKVDVWSNKLSGFEHQADLLEQKGKVFCKTKKKKQWVSRRRKVLLGSILVGLVVAAVIITVLVTSLNANSSSPEEIPLDTLTTSRPSQTSV